MAVMRQTTFCSAPHYDEYPLMMKGIDRIDEDMAMMKAAGLNVIRIAESTWSTCRPQPGVFDFTYVDWRA